MHTEQNAGGPGQHDEAQGYVPLWRLGCRYLDRRRVVALQSSPTGARCQPRKSGRPGSCMGLHWVATMPQMRLLRWFVARRAVEMTRRGEAVDLGCGPGHLVV